jgi:hypothetical protein
VFVYILKMCTSYYWQIWQIFSYIFRMLNLVSSTCHFVFITLSHGRYLVCVIWNSKSVQLILFKLCTVFIYILNDVFIHSFRNCRNNPIDKFHISTFPEKFWCHKANILTSQCSMTWFTLIGFESIVEIHSLKVMGNSSVDSIQIYFL